MRSQEERDAAAVWLQKQHEQFFEAEKILNVDFCHECHRIVEEGTEHDGAMHGAVAV